MVSSKTPRPPMGAKATGAAAGRVQRQQDARDCKTPPKAAVQAGARKHPVRPSTQHQSKTGRKARLALAPQFMAPDYLGSGKLEGFSAIVTGGDSGIGRAAAVLFAREGADVTIVYLESLAR